MQCTGWGVMDKLVDAGAVRAMSPWTNTFEQLSDGSPREVGQATWLMALLSALLVGFSGVLPIFYGSLVYSKHLKLVLSFAVGCLLGDVFFHMLPEVWRAQTPLWSGLWVVAGVFVFFLVEKSLKLSETSEADAKDGPHCQKGVSKVTGYLNLFANCTDNFAHGIAIAASYLISPGVGAVTTVAILCHEIPHEVGDFAVLISSGFDLWSAVKAQLLTSLGGLVGVTVGLLTHHCTDSVAWMLAFTAGGFLYLGFVSILPSTVQGEGPMAHSLPFVMQLAGVLSMVFVTVIEHHVCSAQQTA